MKKLLLVFCITLSFIIPALRAHAQTFDWSCFTTNGAVLADANDIATVAFTNANCPIANGFSLQVVGTGQLRTLVSIPAPGTNPFLRISKNGAAAVFNYARLFRTSGGLFTLTSISVTPSTVGPPPVGPGPQAITVHAYRSGTEVGTASTAILSTFGLVNIPSSQLGANFANIDEIRFTTSGANGFGVCIDDVVVAVAGSAPTVTTGSFSAVTSSSATLTGNVSSDGGATVSDKGIVYGLASDPTIVNTKLPNGSGTGPILVNAPGLAANTTYHYRAYATNVIGTSYGADQTFTTLVANRAPVAVADNYNYTIGVPLIAAAPGILGNDADADNNPLLAILVSGPAHGSLTLNSNGSFSYIPSGNTADQFTYKANDGTADGNTVTVTLSPSNVLPVAVADNYTYTIGTPLVIAAPGILNNDTDANGDALSAVLVSGPAHGTLALNPNGSFTYTPSGTTADQFTYSTSDGTGVGNTVTVTLSPGNIAPVAVADSYTIAAGPLPVPLIVAAPGVLSNDTDANGDALTAILVSAPTHGAFNLQPNGGFNYVPFVGTTADQFTYKVNDGTVDGNTVTVILSQANSLPVTVADSYSFQTGKSLNIAAPGLLSNDTDSNGDPLTAVLVAGPANGTLTLNANGSLTYTSSGTTNDQFTYKANDGKGDGNTVTVTLNHINSAPVSTDDTYTLNENANSSNNVLTNDTDADGNSLTASLVTAPVNGTVVLNADGSFTYTPNNNYFGNDSFVYQVCDNGVPSLCDTATANFHVLAVNQAPVLTTSAGATIFTGASAVAIDNAVTVTDPDNNTLASAFIEITHGFHPGDVLAFTASGATGNIAGSYDSANGILPLTSAGASATLAQWQAALRSITYQSTAPAPNTDTRLISFGANDGNKTSATVTKNITIAVPVISTSGALSALTTIYGTPSVSATFNVSGVSLTDGILVTAPTGFEVSKDNITFSHTVTIGTSGTIASTPVHIRLAAGMNAGSYSGNVVLSSASASNVNVATVASTVNKAPLTITANSNTKVYGAPVPLLAVSYSGFVGTDNASGLTTAPTVSTTAVTNSPVNTYPVTASGAVSSNYTFVYQPGTLTVTPAALTITANNKGKAFGQVLTGGPGSTAFTSAGLVNSETIGSVTITYGTGAAAGAPVNTYTGSVVASAATGGTFTPTNYAITYVAGNIIVGQAVLTITANNANKVYGALVPALSVSYSGFIGTDDASSLTTQPTISTTAVTSSPVNTYPITVSGAVSSNYTIVYNPGILTITPAALTVTANNANKVYGAPVPTLAVSYSGFIGTDNASSLTTAPTISTPVTINSPVNTYPITASGAVSSNYTFVYQPGTLTVTPATLTITANSDTKVYGAPVPTLTVSYSGFVGADNASSLTTAPTISTTAVTNSPVNTYPITASGAVSANYSFVYKPGVLTITKAALTVTANAKTKTYGDVDPALTYSVTGGALVGTDAFTGTLSRDPGENAGTYAIKQGSLALNANYVLTYQGTNLTITKRAITITADPQTKPYGTADPALTFHVASGLLAFADTFTGTLRRDAGENAGTYAIKQGSLALSNNYTLTYNGADLTITQKVLTITANNATKTYGSVNPALGVSYSGFVGTDNAASLTTAPTITTTALTNSPVNAYPITASGAVSANYSFVYKPGVLTVTPAALTITANNATKTYGSVNPALGVSYSGFVGADNAASLTTAPTVTTTAVTISPVNAYPITASGAASVNYAITYKPGVLTVTRAALTITANDKSKSYGQALTGGAGSTEFTSTGLVNSETVGTVTITYGAGAAANAAVNTYTGSVAASAATGGTFAPGNYNINYIAGDIIIGKKVLTITANNATKIYGSANPALSVSYSGFTGTDDASSLTTAPTVSTTALTNSPVSTYPVTANGAASANYTIVYKPGVLTVTPATLTITANNATKTYGSVNPSFSVSYSGFVGTDNAASLTTAPTVTTTAVTNSPVNTYPITASGAVSANYSLVYKPGVLTVTPAALTITANNATKTYGSVNPALSVSYSGFVGTDNASSLTTAPTISTIAVINSPVNTYPITASGAVSANYSLVYKPGVLTVTPAALTITANNATKTYGSVNPALSVSYSGFVGTDNAASLTTAPTVTTTAVTNSPVNTYPITASGAVSSNYAITYKAGVLTVTRAALTITANNATKTYGSVNPPLSVSYSGFVGADDASSLTTAPTVTTTAVTNSPVNTYPITASGAVSANYSFVYKPSVLTVTPAALTITANNATKTYGSVNPALSVSYSGFVGTDNASSLTTVPTVTTTAVTSSPVNTYPITASGAVSANYTIVYKPGVLTVTQAALTITANNATKTYGSINPALSVSYSGFVGTDNAASLTTAPTVTTTAVTNSPVNTYPITASGAVSPNYAITYKAGVLTVTQAALTIKVNNKTKTYGQALTGGAGSTEFTSAGLVNSETIGSVTITYGAGAAANAAVNTYTGSVVATAATGGTFTPGNYHITYVAGNIIVNQVTLTITANNQSKVYGSANPELTVSYSGFVNGDNASALITKPTVITTASIASAVGTYPITVSGAAVANYKIVYAAGTLTVNKALLTITADNKNRLYGAANPVFTATYSGFVNRDTEASLTNLPALTTAANSTSAPGVYPITASGAVSDNYTFKYVQGKLTVNPLSNANLINLALSSGILSPAFTTGNFAYTTQVDNDVEHIRLTLTFDPTATARINGTLTSADRPSYSIPLNVGNNTITIVITAQDRTTTNTYTLVVYRGADQKDLIVTNILTPNGDGKNDVWLIQDIQLYPDNIVTVYDRGGRTVYTKHGYGNDWNGTYGGAPLTEGTYYYLIDLGPQQRKFKGFITIVRNR